MYNRYKNDNIDEKIEKAKDQIREEAAERQRNQTKYDRPDLEKAPEGMSDFCKNEVQTLKRAILVKKLEDKYIKHQIPAATLILTMSNHIEFDVDINISDIIKAVNGKKKALDKRIKTINSKLGKIKKFKNVEAYAGRIEKDEAEIKRLAEFKNYLETINGANCWRKLNIK